MGVKPPTPKPTYIYHELFDFIFPKGKVGGLCKVLTTDYFKLDLNDILHKFKLGKPRPVIILAGAMASGRDKLLAGISRAAFKTDAVILDSGIRTGIEPFAVRRDVKLVGVCPEHLVKMPKLNPIKEDPYTL